MTDRRSRLLAVIGVFAVLVLIAVLVLVGTGGPGSKDASAPTTTAASGTTAEPGSTASTAATAPPAPTTSAGSGPTNELLVDPTVDAAMDASGSASVIITLNVEPTGSDAEKTAIVQAGLDHMLATLPPGSWSAVRETGTVPVVTLTLAVAGLDSLRASDAAKVVSPNSKRTPTAQADGQPTGTNDPSSAQSTNTMGAVAAWAAGWKGAGSTVAVLDTGVQVDHPYLMRGSTPKTVAEACFATPSLGWTSPCPGGQSMSTTDAPLPGSAAPCPLSSCAHGTHVAGIAVGGDGVSLPSGVAPEANLIAIQVFAYSGSSLGADDGDINAALQWLYLHRTQFPDLAAVNLSLGGGPKNTGYCDLNPTKAFIDQLLTIGVATVIAAGNNGYANGVSSPGCISTAVTVGAVDGNPDTSTTYSNDGPQVDLMAPGSNITSSVPGNAMAVMTGTSMATPAVTGSFAVVHQASAASTLARLKSTQVVVNASGFPIPSVRLNTAVAAYPGPPRSVGIAPAMGQATVSWLAPTSSDTTAVTGYQVTASPGGATCSTAGTLLCTVTGLSPGTSYRFMVRAISATGSGAAVWSASVVMPILPPQPGLNPLNPTRLMDTRTPTATNGVATVDGLELGHGPITAGVIDTFPVNGRGGVPATGVGAVVLNVTVVSPSGSGYLTVFPSGSAAPNASNLNFVAGQTIPNMVITKVGPDGAVSIVTNAGSTQVVVDVVGWFAIDPEYNPLAPARLVETRSGPGYTTIDHVDEGIGPILPGHTLTVPVAGRDGVPGTGVDAVALNVTAVDPTAAGYLTVFPSGTPTPTASNLNFVPGQTVPNMVITKVGADGAISIFNNAGATQVVVDVVGWFPTGSGYTALTPARIMDTRPAGPGITTVDGQYLSGGRFGTNQTTPMMVAGRGNVPPTGVGAVAVNVTVVDPTVSSFLTVFPGATSRPTASNLNFVPGQTVANMVIVRVGADGTISIFNNAGSTNVVVDVVGWFP